VHDYAREEFTCLAQDVTLIIINNTFSLFNYSVIDSNIISIRLKFKTS